jgi:hypothetical protein
VNKLCVILLYFPALLFGQQTIIKEIKIKPYMYTQNYEHFKRLVLDSPNSEAEYVDGFDFEWGYFYTLKVKEIYLGELSDGTRHEYSLLKVISKEKVSDTVIFRMYIDPLRYYHKLEDEGVSNYTLSQLNDSTYIYMDQVEIEIPHNFLESFIKKKDNEIDFRGDFKFVNRKRVRLVSFR